MFTKFVFTKKKLFHHKTFFPKKLGHICEKVTFRVSNGNYNYLKPTYLPTYLHTYLPTYVTVLTEVTVETVGTKTIFHYTTNQISLKNRNVKIFKN